MTWVAASTFHAAQSGEPVGLHYDTANRVGVLVTFLALDAGAVVTVAVTAVVVALWLLTLRSSPEGSFAAA